MDRSREGTYELEIVMRRIRDGPAPRLDSPAAVAQCCADLATRDREVLVVACVDTRKNLIARHEAFVGTLDSLVVHPREILRAAILTMAAGIVVVHNHPSGSIDPSTEDLEFTRRLNDACRLMAIPLIDSIIIGRNGEYWSWADRGGARPRDETFI
jgi:DNA repair protein RadC